MVKLECSKCGSPLEIDPDNPIAFCPYCGQKVLFDYEQVTQIFIEKEKTKQKEFETNKEKEKTKQKELETNVKTNDDRNALIVISMLLGFALLLFIFGCLFFS